MDEKLKFNAALITDKGMVIDDVFATHVDDVLPILKEKFDLKVVSSFIIRQITNK